MIPLFDKSFEQFANDLKKEAIAKANKLGAFKIVAIKKVKFVKPNFQPMTEANFIALAKKRYEALQSLNKIDNFYDHEKEFESIWRELGREVLEANISKVPADRRKKKHLPNLGK